MRVAGSVFRLAAVLFFVCILSGCYYAGPVGPSYMASEVGPSDSLRVGVDDRTYILSVDDRTPFGLYDLPLAQDTLYNKGYDLVRRQREADFAVDVVLSATAHENPDVRGANMLGGALFGAAAGAIIGGAYGDPGAGAAIGAASGGALGLAAPAGTPMVRIDLHLQSFRSPETSQRSRVVDLAGVPPYDVQRIIDNEVARMLQTLPGR